MDKIIKKLRLFNFQRNWEKYHTLKNLSMALTIESSELMNLMKWMSDEEIRTSSQTFYSVLRDEIAGCFIYLLIICDKLDLNEELIKMVIDNKIKKNGIKYAIQKEKSN